MVLVVWFPSRAVLKSHHECTLLQVGSHPDITLDVARMQHNNQQTNQIKRKYLIRIYIFYYFRWPRTDGYNTRLINLFGLISYGTSAQHHCKPITSWQRVDNCEHGQFQLLSEGGKTKCK